MKQNNRKAILPVIGITGGVGSGKSVVLSMLEKDFGAAVIQADLVARELMELGQSCYLRAVESFGEAILAGDGAIDRKALAALVFDNPPLLEKLNNLTHPEVKKEIIQRIEHIREQGQASCIALEAALLIEDGYQTMLDSLWYIYADHATRLRRLSENRGYSREKSLSIMKNQLDEQEFRRQCDVVIDNSRGLDELHEQLEKNIQNIKEIFCHTENLDEGRTE